MSTSPATTYRNGLKTVPYESCINVKPVLVGYCSYCEIVVDPYPGSGHRAVCDGDHDQHDSIYYHHRYHKRRMWKCPLVATGGCDFYFLTRTAFLEHEHGRA